MKALKLFPALLMTFVLFCLLLIFPAAADGSAVLSIERMEKTEDMITCSGKTEGISSLFAASFDEAGRMLEVQILEENALSGGQFAVSMNVSDADHVIFLSVDENGSPLADTETLEKTVFLGEESFWTFSDAQSAYFRLPEEARSSAGIEFRGGYRFGDVVIVDGLDVSVADEAVLMIPEEKTLSVSASGCLLNRGTILVLGAFENRGTVRNLNRMYFYGPKAVLRNGGIVSGNEISQTSVEYGAGIYNQLDASSGVFSDDLTVVDYYPVSGAAVYSRTDASFDFSTDRCNMAALCFRADLAQTALNLVPVENGDYYYDSVILSGESTAEVNPVEVSGISVPEGRTLVLRSTVFDGMNTYVNRYILPAGQSFTVGRNATLRLEGNSELKLYGLFERKSDSQLLQSEEFSLVLYFPNVSTVCFSESAESFPILSWLTDSALPESAAPLWKLSFSPDSGETWSKEIVTAQPCVVLTPDILRTLSDGSSDRLFTRVKLIGSCDDFESNTSIMPVAFSIRTAEAYDSGASFGLAPLFDTGRYLIRAGSFSADCSRYGVMVEKDGREEIKGLNSMWTDINGQAVWFAMGGISDPDESVLQPVGWTTSLDMVDPSACGFVWKRVKAPAVASDLTAQIDLLCAFNRGGTIASSVSFGETEQPEMLWYQFSENGTDWTDGTLTDWASIASTAPSGNYMRGIGITQNGAFVRIETAED